MNFFPRNLKSHFPNLKNVDFSASGIEEVSQADFSVLTELTHLELDGYKIKLIPENLFASNPAMQYIDLSGNPQTTVGSDVFDNLKNLETLHFYDRNCVINGSPD